jgi:phytoene dehydrogenase-like protein
LILKTVAIDALHHVPIGRWLRTRTSDPDVLQLILCMVRHTTYCDEPARLSASAAIEQLRLSISGSVLYLHRGWASLVAALQAAAVAGGTTFINGAAALTIEGSRARATAVTLANGARLPAGAVIVATPPRVARALLESMVDYHVDATEVRVATLDVALHHLPRKRTVFAFGIDEPWAFSADSTIARVAPNGAGVVHLVKYLRGGAVGTPADEGELDRVLDLLQPGWRRAIAYRHFVPTMPVAHAMVNADQGGFAGRPSERVPGVDNVFVAGDWVGPVGQLADASIASAVEAARAAAREMSEAWKE